MTPLFSFLQKDTTLQSLEDAEQEIAKVTSAGGQLDDPLHAALEWFVDKIRLTLWCISQHFVGPGWTPRSILELCTEQASTLNALKVLGCLSMVDEAQMEALLANQPSSLDAFRGFLAAAKFVRFTFKHFNLSDSAVSSLEDVERLLAGIRQPGLCLQVLEDLFALCFLRREDVLFEETASDSADGAGEEASPAPESLRGKSSNKKATNNNDPYSNGNSPNNSQTGGTSSAAPADKKGDLSFGFLCQDPHKLQVDPRDHEP